MPKRELGIKVPDRIWNRLVGEFKREATITNVTKEVRLREFRAYPCEYPSHAAKSLWVIFQGKQAYSPQHVRCISPQKMAGHLAEIMADLTLGESLSNDLDRTFVDYRAERENNKVSLG